MLVLFHWQICLSVITKRLLIEILRPLLLNELLLFLAHHTHCQRMVLITVTDRPPARSVGQDGLQQATPRDYVSVSLYVHRNRKAYLGRGGQDGHLHFHTAPEL